MIGYQDQGNLGLGYLAAVLQEAGYDVDFVEIRDGAETIAARFSSGLPLLVGFSLIFQGFFPEFQHVANQLRSVFRGSHFTIGGHFPSLCPERILAEIPALDSVVRFEGEETLTELANRVSAGKDWHDIRGIAYVGERGVIKNEPRQLIEDLDSLPFPYRPYKPGSIGRFRTLPILASRGCVRRCSFCSIQNFYRNAPGKVVRVRKPDKVVEEMQYLHQRRGIRVFLFQDDDFPLWSARGRRWAKELADRFHDNGLADRIIWKISCRAEYVEPELFSMLRDAGLFLVYLGLESGNAEGLKVLHKELTTECSLQAVHTLKQLGISANYGFMLFDPSSSFETVRQNVDFLRAMAGDGHSSVTFGRMMPYEGTAIRETLQLEGRLKGSIASPDYDFYDHRLNHYCLLLFRALGPWLDKNGFSDELNFAWYELEAVRRLVPDVQGLTRYRDALRTLTSESNGILLRMINESSLAVEQGERWQPDSVFAEGYCKRGRARLLEMRNSFIVENIDLLMRASEQPASVAS